MNYGIIDIGSNTIRIVVYGVGENHFECLFNEKQFVQLIDYVKNGTMRDEGIRSLIYALNRLQQMAAHFNPVRIYCFATAPFRAVKDRQYLTDAIRNFTGLEVETLSGEEEARLGLTGARYVSGIDDGLFVDLGGGSMEISLLKNAGIAYAQSIDLGCVSVSSRFVSGILPTKKETNNIKKFADARLSALPWLGEAQGLDMYGIGGTARALGQLHKVINGSSVALQTYAFGVNEIKDVYHAVTKMKTEGVRLMSKYCPGRIFTFVPGAIVLWRLAKMSGVQRIRFSTFGVREGYLIRRILPEASLENEDSPDRTTWGCGS